MNNLERYIMRFTKLLRYTLPALLAFSLISCTTTNPRVSGDNSTRHRSRGQNIIIMISDGCGFNHVDAASMYQYGRTGEQVYESFPVQLAMSTYSAAQDYNPAKVWSYFNQVMVNYTDSAAAATAMATGCKSYNGALGVDMDRYPIVNVTQCAEKLGKATGVVTTVQSNNATPAGFIAHCTDRNNNYEIVREMVYESSVDVIMGAGHPKYDADSKPKADPSEYNYTFMGTEDIWNDLSAGTAGGDADGDGIPDPWLLLQTADDFRNLMSGDAPKRVFGVAQVTRTLQQERGGDVNAAPYDVPLNDNVPTLSEMTMAALNVLDNDPDGFLLMIEGGAVDWASHANQSGRLIEEQIDFNAAVETVVEWVEENSNWRNTLLIVTSDHETGYITGPASGLNEDGPVWNPLVNNGAGKLPGMEWHSGSHTHSLVPFYAKGRGSRIFKSYADENDPVRGRYLDNTEMGKAIFKLLQ